MCEHCFIQHNYIDSDYNHFSDVNNGKVSVYVIIILFINF